MRHRAALGPYVVDRVLDRVERRSLLVEPAREDSLELALRVADVELDEGAGQLLSLPGRGGLAGAKPDDGVADPDRLARPELEIARDSVALVEKADHRDPPRHGGRPRGDRGHRLGDVDGFGLRLGLALVRNLRTAVARGQQSETGEEKSRLGPRPDHSWPGVQAS